MNLWQKLVLLVLFLTCLVEQVLAAPKKTDTKAPAKKTEAKKDSKKAVKGKKAQKEEEDDEEDQD
jgi:hypothetical protein